MPDEILVKGQDGKWYILKGEELVPFEEAKPAAPASPARPVEVSKGVKEKVHERLEGKPPLNLPLVKGEKEGVVAVPSIPISHAEHPLFKELEELIDRVVAQSGISFPDPVLQKRLRTLVSSRLRDVRDTLEARAILTRDQKVGGIGLQEDGCAKVEGSMEKAVAEFQAKWKAVEAKRREEWRLKQREQRDQREQREQAREQRELEERYSRLTGGIPKSKFLISKEIPKPKIQIPKAPEPTKPKPLLPSPPPAIIPSPPSRPSTMALPSPPSPPLARGEKIRDIRPGPKILGPVEELRSLTLEDFRRIPGANAPERIQKIMGKIEFLGQESLSRRAQGLEAWRTSPLHSLYSQIVSGALASKTAPEAVISKLVSEGKLTLTLEEFHGIMEMNQKLRF